MIDSLDAVINVAILYTPFFQNISLNPVNYGLVVFVSDFIYDGFIYLFGLLYSNNNMLQKS